ncbi:MAG TPA: hypothetical protein VF505_04910 [Thermoanaerobaculia bacterium]|jgi:hypothetical protein
MLFRRLFSLLALVTVCLCSAVSVLAATAAPERRLVFTEAAWPRSASRSVSYERRTDPSGQIYIASVIRQGSRKAEVSITPTEIVFDDGYAIRRNVEMDSPEMVSWPQSPYREHVETLTAFSPNHEKSATMRIRLTYPIPVVTGRREFAQLLHASASFRLLAGRPYGEDSRRFVKREGGVDDFLDNGSSFLCAAVNLIEGESTWTILSGQSLVYYGRDFAKALSKE